MSNEQIAQAKREAADSVAAWLLTLELARSKGDFDRAAEAQRELRKRGVIVRYGQPVAEGQAIHAH